MTVTNQLASFEETMRASSKSFTCAMHHVWSRDSQADYAEPLILDMSVSAIAAGVSATAIPAAKAIVPGKLIINLRFILL